MKRILFFLFFSIVLSLQANRRPPALAENKPENDLFGRYVAVGDSFTQGFQSGAVDETRQDDAYAARIARAMHTKFEIPLLRFPGYQVNLEDVARGRVRWFQWYCAIAGCRKSFDNQDSLSNFAIPGETVRSALSWGGSLKGFRALILGDGEMPQLTQALNRNPSFLSIWIGNGDVTGSILHRDLLFSSPLESFQESFRTIVSRVSQKQSAGLLQGVIIANLPDASAGAYLKCAPDGQCGAFWDSYVTGPDDTLDAEELESLRTQMAQVNREIQDQAMANGWAVFDAHSFFQDLEERGYSLSGGSGALADRRLSAEYLGGFYSLDGIHPSSTGQAVLANRFIDAINSRYGKNLTHINETAASTSDSLYERPIDPRINPSPWYGRAMTFLLSLFI